MEPITTTLGTELLAKRTGFKKLEANPYAFDLLIAVWAEQHEPDLHGVWWNETLDEEALSAPRGGIFPSAIPGLIISPADEQDCDASFTHGSRRRGLRPK